MFHRTDRPLSRRMRAMCLWAATVFATSLALPAFADTFLVRASGLAGQGRCEEALAVVDEARAAGAVDARLLRLAGQCQINLRRHVDAVPNLEEAKRLDPNLDDVDLYLGIARFHVGDLAAAQEAIDAAAARDPQRAEVNLYQGLLLLQRAENAEAAAALERARIADPDAVEPVASYYMGAAFAGQNDRARSEEALRRVIAMAPGTRWAEEAQRALDGSAGEGPGRWWVQATAGFEYDNNVILRGSGVALPEDISSRRDIRGALWVEAGLEFLRTERWTLGGLVRSYLSQHQDLNDFDLLYPTLTLWADYRIGPDLTARLQYDGGYAWADSDPFLESHAWTAALYQEWGDPGRTRLFSHYYRYDYKVGNEDVPDGSGIPFSLCLRGQHVVCAPPGIDESTARNRDGYGITFGFDHWLPVADGRVELRTGYRFLKYSSRGSEYSYTGHEGRLGARIALPFEFVLDVLGRYTYKPYRNRSTFPDPDELFFNRQYPLANHQRRDNIIQVDVGIERKITRHLSGSIRYSYIRNRSDVAVFDYRREIIGAYLTVRFQEGDL